MVTMCFGSWKHMVFILLPISLASVILAENCDQSCNSLPQIPDCGQAVLYSAPDDCGCLHWYCKDLSGTENELACPLNWNSYQSNAGLYCTKTFNVTSTWEQASLFCSSHYDSTLFNVREFEAIAETQTSDLYMKVIRDLQNETLQEPHWNGLRLIDDKFYWDGKVPYPDRDHNVISESLVKFRKADWEAMSIGRRCMSYHAMSYLNPSMLAIMVPDFCDARLPFICSKLIRKETKQYYKADDDFLCNEDGWKASLDSSLCYKYTGELLNFEDAKSTCSEEDATLADPRGLANQGFIFNILSELSNGTAPLSIHVGVEQVSADNIVFPDGQSVQTLQQLQQLSINSAPSPNKQCGMLWNPHYAEGRSADSVVEFDACTGLRPFICSKNITTEPTASNARLNVRRDGDKLFCEAENLNIHGQFMWKKDHQYFPNQPLAANITLKPTQFRRLIGGNASLDISNGDYTGQYACEFWQTYPRKVYKSGLFSVLYNDTLSLRLSSELASVLWSEEFEGFNARVSHFDELTEGVQEILKLIVERTDNLLSKFGQSELQYRVHLLSIRKTPDNHPVVEYKVLLSGPLVEDATLISPSTNSSLEDVVKTLDTAADNESTTASSPSNSTVTGQLLCLERILVHPETQEELVLPLTLSGQSAKVRGDCHGEDLILLEASCVYSEEQARSRWVGVKYKDCATDCLPLTLRHNSTQTEYSLPNGVLGANTSIEGKCGSESQQLFAATCTENGWAYKEKPCVLTCPPFSLQHPQWPTKIPENEVSAGRKVIIDMKCNKTMKTILSATCVKNSDNQASWNVTTMSRCEVFCPPKTVQHPSGFETTLTRSDLNRTVNVSRKCNGEHTVLISAKCTGSLADGATWNVTLTDCDVKCPALDVSHRSGAGWELDDGELEEVRELTGNCNGEPATLAIARCEGSPATGGAWTIQQLDCSVNCPAQIFIHPDTLQVISLQSAALNTNKTVTLQCNGKDVRLDVQCQGNVTGGARWRMLNLQKCDPLCSDAEWIDPVTKKTYYLKSAPLHGQSVVKGSCGGKEETILISDCVGNLISGVYWTYRRMDCKPTCQNEEVKHPDFDTTFSLPVSQHGNHSEIIQNCDGQPTSVVTATCGGQIEDEPRWLNITLNPCKGYCKAKTITLHGTKDERKVEIPKKEVGESMNVTGLCALVDFTQVEAVCIGDRETGGEWEIEEHRCLIDDSCLAVNIAQDYTMQRMELPRGDVNQVVQLKGDCNGKEVVMLRAKCEATVGKNGVWKANHTECIIEEDEVFSNLLKNFYNDPAELSRLAGKLTENLTKPSAGLVSNIADITEYIAAPDTPKRMESEGDSFFDIISNMMMYNSSVLNSHGSNHTEPSSIRLLKSVESFTDSSNLTSPSITIQKQNLIIKAVNAMNGSEDEMQLKADDVEANLSPEITKNSRVTFVKYNNPTLFGNSEKLLGGSVISAQVAEKMVKNVQSAITFKIQVPENTTGNPACVYWNFEQDDWSTDGCRIVGKDNSSITCSCEHLTNFAILMDIDGQASYIAEEHHVALSVISMVGLSISIVCLSLHLLAFFFIMKLRENQFQKVLANLVVAILISDLIFVTGITETQNENACIAVAALLHYFILASFAWMFVEALMQYRRFVQVFGTHVTHILIKAGLPAWLLPLIPVIILLIIDPQLYRGGEKFCWMKPEPLYYAFLLPIGCIIVANIVLFGLIVKGLICARKGGQLRTNKSESQLRNMYLKAALAVFILLGLTWIFGFLAMTQHTKLVFQYLFCITNSLQGLTIFILHNIRDPKVINWWRKIFHLKPKRGKLYTGSSSGSKAFTTNSSIIHSESTIKREKPSDSPILTPVSTPSEPKYPIEDETANTKDTLEVPEPKYKTEVKIKPGYHHLLQTKMYSSTESDTSHASAATCTSDV